MTTQHDGIEQYTGRLLVVLEEDHDAGARAMEASGLRLVTAETTPDGGMSAEDVGDADGVLFPELGVAVLSGSADSDQMSALAERIGRLDGVATVEPERYVDTAQDLLFADADSDLHVPVSYLRGFRDAVDALLERAADGSGTAVEAEPEVVWNESLSTWGLQTTKVTGSSRSGRGVRVAVLDTGLDFTHPDFAGRVVRSMSFVPGETVQDRRGHGTHCIGTACGPKKPAVGPRYGVAHGCEIYVGKVLNNMGRGTDGWILAGINWAIANRCRVVSMSLGAPVSPGQPFSAVFEVAARRALAAGTLIVAAAGNDGGRPVSHPANCPSIMAVGALDQNLVPAPFSSIGVNPNGGAVDIAAPGVNVYSSYPMPQRYRRMNGTSMAAPHVAGIAALYIEANPAITASALWRLLQARARRLPFPVQRVGAGLAQSI